MPETRIDYPSYRSSRFVLPDAAVHSLRSALRADAVDGPAALHTTAEHLIAAARDAHLQPEQFIVLLKRTWQSLPEVLDNPDRAGADRMLGRMVSMCIEAFFREPPR